MSLAAKKIPGSVMDWKSVTSYRIPAALQKAIYKRRMSAQRVKSAYWELSADFYSAFVTKLPKHNGKRMAAAELLEHIRLHISESFVSDWWTDFKPYTAAVDGPIWKSKKPVGAVVHIDMMMGIGPVTNVDDGSVVCGEHSADHFALSTIWAPDDLYHPVSGTRIFGWFEGAKGAQRLSTADGSAPADKKTRFQAKTYVFYTMGADRTASWSASTPVLWSIVMASQKATWNSLVDGIVKFVNDNEGRAKRGTNLAHKLDWDSNGAELHQPTVKWVTEAPEDEHWFMRVASKDSEAPTVV